jgi:hypothetical protein
MIMTNLVANLSASPSTTSFEVILGAKPVSVTEVELQSLVADGALGRETQVRRLSDGAILTLGTVPALQTHFPGAQAPAVVLQPSPMQPPAPDPWATNNLQQAGFKVCPMCGTFSSPTASRCDFGHPLNLKRCPTCGYENSAESLRCLCGYAFDGQADPVATPQAGSSAPPFDIPDPPPFVIPAYDPLQQARAEAAADHNKTARGFLIFMLIFSVGNAILYLTTGHIIIPIRF